MVSAISPYVSLVSSLRKTGKGGNGDKPKKRSHVLRGVILFLVGFALGSVTILSNYYLHWSEALLPEKVEEAPATYDVEVLKADIQQASDLVLSYMTTRDVITYENNGLPYITKSKYWILYTGKVTASVDLSKVQLSQDDTNIVVSIPHATRSEFLIDASEFKYMDGETPIFNEEMTVLDTLSRAKAQAEAMDYSELLSQADLQAIRVIHGFADKLDLGGRTLKIQWVEDDGSLTDAE